LTAGFIAQERVFLWGDAIMAGSVTEVNDANFEEEVLKAEIPVLVDFWAPWCGPCLMVGPVVKEFAEENAGKIKVCKMNTDESIKTAQKYGIMSIPTLMVFKGGEKVAQLIGAMPKEQLTSNLSQYLD
jgi:thioredoxin 1